MYNGIGLQTARGSGTNGYIQTNKFFIKPKTNKLTSKSYETGQGSGGVSRGPNKEILEHDRKRQIHLKLAVLEDKLIDQGYTDDEIAVKLDEVRNTLEAAMASEDACGATALVLNPDHKYSDTQTHQLAARKEKQMESLKNALGIVHEDDLKKYLPGSDDAKIDDGDKTGNTKKTDRSFDGKLEKDTKAGKDGLDQLKQYKKKTKKRRVPSSSDSSDSDSRRENVKVSKKKQQKSRGRSDTESDSGSDSDVDIRNNRQKLSSKHSKSRRHDSDDSRDTKKHVRTVKRYQSESDGNSSSDESPNIKSRKGKQLSSRSRRHDSDDDSDSDASPVDKYGRRQLEDKRKEKRMESKVEKDISTRDDYGRGINDRWDGGSSKRDVPRDTSPVRGRTHEKDRLGRIGRRHDTDDEESDEDIHHKKEEVERGGRWRHGRDYEVIDKSDIRLKERETVRGGRNEDSNRKDIKSGEKRHIEERKTERVESGGRRRHDSDDDDDIDDRRRRDNVGRDGRRRHDGDLEPFDKKIRTGEKRQRGIEEHKKGRVEGGGRRHDSDDDDDIDARRTKQKVERDGRKRHDVNREEFDQKEIRTGGSRQSGIEENKKERVESAGRRRHDSDDDGDSDVDIKHTKVDRGGNRQEDVNYEKTTKIPSRDEQRHRSKTSDDEDEKYLEGRKENRDEEDGRGRKHKRDEDDEKHKKPEKGRELRESKYSRDHDEEHESRRGDRDSYADNSKRTRYDSERRHDGGRSRH
uniref:CWF21 domain-containing protein n=1 Tax=Tanacetum cinerariifolium TaxID=118510 RepID=A0A699GTE2_TANCI|nr:hypothetical protein [Tanacetum cinerariifolium]